MTVELAQVVAEVEHVLDRLRVLKAVQPSRRLSVAFTKLEEGLLWLRAEADLGAPVGCCKGVGGCQCK